MCQYYTIFKFYLTNASIEHTLCQALIYSALQIIICLILITTLYIRYYHPHFES